MSCDCTAETGFCKASWLTSAGKVCLLAWSVGGFLSAAGPPAAVPLPEFLADRSARSLGEIQAAQVARERSSDSDVRSLADQILFDHGRITAELQQLAASNGFAVSQEPALRWRATNELLKLKRGEAFDLAFATGMIVAHEREIEELKRISRQSPDPKIKPILARLLSIQRKHLSAAKVAQTKQLEQKSENSKDLRLVQSPFATSEKSASIEARLLADPPFTRSLGKSESLRLTGLAYIDGKPVATIVNNATGERHIVSNLPNAEGWTLLGVVPGSSTSLGHARAKIKTPERIVTVGFDLQSRASDARERRHRK